MAPSVGSGDEGPLARLAQSWTRLDSPDDPAVDSRLTMLMPISLVIGLLSTLATSFALYWFAKMRRNFRHE